MNTPTIEPYLQTIFSSPINILILFLFSASTAIVTYLLVWFKLRLFVRAQDKITIEKNKRDAFKLLLDRHSDLFLGKPQNRPVSDWLSNFSEMSKDILLWGSDTVLANYGNYALLRANNPKISQREVYFAKAIMAFRKGIGYKNWFWRVKPKHIIVIFRVGFEDEA